jgi:hypothetical protein
VPVATNTIAANPDAFYGQAVTITASVEQILSKTSFTVDQRRVGDAPAPKQPTDVLVLVPNIQRPVDLKSYVTVMGDLIKFDPAEVAKKAKDYKIDLPPEAAAKYAGRPVLIATSVINDKFDDVAKRLPPPLNAEEEAFQKVMRAVGPAAAALRPAVDSSNAEVAAKNARSCSRLGRHGSGSGAEGPEPTPARTLEGSQGAGPQSPLENGTTLGRAAPPVATCGLPRRLPRGFDDDRPR